MCPGRVSLVQGGSAANTARWLARLGARSRRSIAAVGRDAAGRALVEALRGDGVRPASSASPGAGPAAIGVLVSPDGERSFVADRGAATQLPPTDLQAGWFARADARPSAGRTRCSASRWAGPAGGRSTLAREAGAIVSVDLASIGPLLAHGRRAARTLIEDVAPDLLFATAAEAEALLGRYAVGGPARPRARSRSSSAAPKGATVLARDGDERLRFEVATEHRSRRRHDRRRRRVRRRASWSAGSPPAQPAAPCRPRSSGRP